MTHTTIEVSAQFGGRDAAAAVLPHFRALKSAAQGMVLDEFPFKKLGFILRVDGNVTSYGLAGAENVDVDERGEYVSADIGLKRDGWSSASVIVSSVQMAIIESVQLLRNLELPQFRRFDFGRLEGSLAELCSAYAIEVRETIASKQ